MLEVADEGGPRVYDASGIPLYVDNETQERIYLDKADSNLMHDDITTIDHALYRVMGGQPELQARRE